MSGGRSCRIKIINLAVFTIFLLAGMLDINASVPDSTKPELIAVKINNKLKLSGKLDDPAWLKAIPVELKYEVMPGENTPAKQRTVVMALYDAENLYIGFRCYDSIPKNIRANLSDRDNIFSDDYVLVAIDPYNNYQRGYEFAVNPFGIQGDLLNMGGGNEDPSYDMVWQSAAAKDSLGWTAEMAIPFKALVFSSAEKQTWTIGLFRNFPRKNRYILSWTPIDRNVLGFLSQGGLLTGLESIRSGKPFEILPYIIAQKSGAKSNIADPLSPINNGHVTGRIGGGIQYSPGPSMSINAVINPDFSQIESDADQVTINTTFALNYPEKRPFFMAGMDLVQTPMYYSRTINNPIFASKINGKAGKFSYLALTAWDRNTVITIPGEEESNTILTSKESFASVGRLRYDLGNESFIGLLLLSRNLSYAHNYVSGFDWNYKFWKNWYWQGEIFLSHTRELNDTALFKSDRLFGPTRHTAGFDGESYFGRGMHLTLMRQGRNYSFSVTQNNFSPTYQTYNGLFPEVGQRTTDVHHQYVIQPNKKVLKSAHVYLNTTLTNNYERILKTFTFQPGFTFYLIGQTVVSVGYTVFSRERFRNVFFGNTNRVGINFQTVPFKGVSLTFTSDIGRFIYRTDTPVTGRGYNISSSVDLQPFSRLKTSLTWTTSSLKDNVTGQTFFNGHILRNLTTFQFTRLLFLRNILQYNTFSRTFSIYPLITYKFNAFTMFCAGMTRDFNNYETEGYTLRTTGYQYFIKLQYLFQ